MQSDCPDAQDQPAYPAAVRISEMDVGGNSAAICESNTGSESRAVEQNGFSRPQNRVGHEALPQSMSPVETLLQLGYSCDYLVHVGYRAEDHTGHGFIVPSQISEHSVVRS